MAEKRAAATEARKKAKADAERQMPEEGGRSKRIRRPSTRAAVS